MKNFVKALALISIVAVLAGCGGSGTTTMPMSGGTGKMSVDVNWPEFKYLPAQTTKITISITQAGVEKWTGDIVRPAKSITSGDLEAGAYVVNGSAFDAAGNKLATATADVTIEAGKLASVLLRFVVIPEPDPITTDEWTIAGSSPTTDPVDPTKTRITLSSILEGGVPIEGLTAGEFELWIDGFLVGSFTITATSSTTSKVDIAFAIDSTGSMSGTLTGVQSSVVAFVDALTAAGMDAKLAGVDFYDKVGRQEYDAITDINDEIFGRLLDKTAEEFKTWVGTLYASGGGDGPEVSVDGIYELNSRVAWRDDAQHIIIAFTDVTSHQRGDGTDFALWTGDEAIAACLGKTVVHTVSPAGTKAGEIIGNDGKPVRLTRADDLFDIATIALATGGKDMAIGSGAVDLGTLGIAATISKGYVITFTTPSGGIHRVRLIMTKDGKVADWIWEI